VWLVRNGDEKIAFGVWVYGWLFGEKPAAGGARRDRRGMLPGPSPPEKEYERRQDMAFLCAAKNVSVLTHETVDGKAPPIEACSPIRGGQWNWMRGAGGLRSKKKLAERLPAGIDCQNEAQNAAGPGIDGPESMKQGQKGHPLTDSDSAVPATALVAARIGPGFLVKVISSNHRFQNTGSSANQPMGPLPAGFGRP